MLNGIINLDAVVIATAVRSHFQMAKGRPAGRQTCPALKTRQPSPGREELVELARKKGLVLMTGHTFLSIARSKKIKEIIAKEVISGEIRYVPLGTQFGTSSKGHQRGGWDLAPHDISIIQHIIGEQPCVVNKPGQRCHIHARRRRCDDHVFEAIPKNATAIIHSIWLDPRKVREMTIVGSKRMIVYDDVAPLEKIRVFDSRVERPPHYDTFAEFHYAYHYGDVYAPYIKQEEPLKTECQHFSGLYRSRNHPLTDGRQGLELVRILEASSESLKTRRCSH